MKRIEAACITQTILFANTEGTSREYTERKIQEDGSVLVEIVREYNNKSVGTYFD